MPGRRGGKDGAGGGWEREAGEGRQFREVRTAAWLQEAAAAAPEVSLGKLVLGRGGGCGGLRGEGEALPPTRRAVGRSPGGVCSRGRSTLVPFWVLFFFPFSPPQGRGRCWLAGGLQTTAGAGRGERGQGTGLFVPNIVN